MDLHLDAARVFLADQGRRFDRGKPTSLWLHGAGMDHSVWPLQARHFAYRGWNALALDLPGHGRSEGDLLTSIEAMADWLARLIDALGIARAASWGIRWARWWRSPAPRGRRKRSSASRSWVQHPPCRCTGRCSRRRQGPRPLGPRMICDWGFGPAGHFGGHRSPGSWMLGHALALLGRSAGQHLHTDLAACNAYAGGLDDAARVACPALVVAGALDRMTPARQGAKLAGAIAGARLVSLPRCGHMMMIEQPDATRDALDEFLTTPGEE